MIVTKTQQAEISEYIITVPKYRETYNELYDHILSSLAEVEDQPFNIELVAKIINEDFGGFKTIVCAEADYNKEAIKNCIRDLRMEMKKQFYFPELWKTLMVIFICWTVYNFSAGDFKVIRVLYVSTLILSLIPIVYYWGRRFIFRRKGSKPSIKDQGFAQTSMLLLQFSYGPFFLFAGNDKLIDVTPEVSFFIMLFMFFFASVYIRAFFALYNRNVKILFAS
ncbi:MAG: hypothetical protein EOO88_06285 [Pedobacter sp.]|nr:MAG: hypothetical protein EOO88_06285 [Pedobacter sp.]